MSDQILLEAMKLLGFMDVVVVGIAVLLLAAWMMIDNAMRIANFTPLFIQWRWAEWKKRRGRIVTQKPENSP